MASEKPLTTKQANGSGMVIEPENGRQTEANERLAQMGYDQELNRNFSFISILSVSFNIMAPLLGLSTTLNIALTNGGPVTIIWGWVFVSLVSTCIAASLGEICSVYPTSGGVYYWSAMLSKPKYSAAASYINGWLGVVGNWTVTLSITFSGAQLILAAGTLWHEDYVPTPWQTVLCCWGCFLMTFAVNVIFNRHLERLNVACLYWTGASIISVLLAKAPSRNSGAYVFGEFDASFSGWPSGWSFFIGLLNAAYTQTGYGMIAAMCEEVQNPQREVPKAMVWSVVAVAITGLIYIIPLCFVLTAIPDLIAVASLQPIPLLFKLVVGSPGGAFGLLFLILGIWWFAAVSSLTAASRATWSFARDGGIPASGLWKKVNPKLGLPLNALILSVAVQALLTCIYFGSSAAFSAFTNTATICLGASYMFPIACSVLRKRKLVKEAPFSLGKFGFIINGVTIVWVLFSIILFCMPTAIPVTPITMNYASVVFVGFFTIAAIWYIVNARKHFTGPQILTVKASDGTIKVLDDVGDAEVPGERDFGQKVVGGEMK